MVALAAGGDDEHDLILLFPGLRNAISPPAPSLSCHTCTACEHLICAHLQYRAHALRSKGLDLPPQCACGLRQVGLTAPSFENTSPLNCCTKGSDD
eukprot:scaffold116457_cov15-Tisochrysis_lutea.AAC.1